MKVKSTCRVCGKASVKERTLFNALEFLRCTSPGCKCDRLHNSVRAEEGKVSVLEILMREQARREQRKQAAHPMNTEATSEGAGSSTGEMPVLPQK